MMRKGINVIKKVACKESVSKLSENCLNVKKKPSALNFKPRHGNNSQQFIWVDYGMMTGQ